MITTIHSCALIGLAPHLVQCEVDLSRQLPALQLVGLPSNLTQESRDRIRAAITNSGFDWPARKITINLLPAALPKWGAHFELAMSLGILHAAENDSEESDERIKIFAIGEHSLSGKIQPSKWIAGISSWIDQLAKEHRREHRIPMVFVFHPTDAYTLLPSTYENAEVIITESLADAHEKLTAVIARQKEKLRNTPVLRSHVDTVAIDESELKLELLKKVEGEPVAKVAAILSIALRLHALFVGPQGAGKSMLLRAICLGARKHDDRERAEFNSLLSLFGDHFNFWDRSEFSRNTVYLQSSITKAGLEGTLHANGQVGPGEFSRAHHGILVADEFLEFRRDVIEAFRQPVEEKRVRLQRAKFKAEMPADFQFLASTNLCPCGYFGSSRRKCRCRESARANYQRKLSGPILDRFDLVCMVGDVQNLNLQISRLSLQAKRCLEDLLDETKWCERLTTLWKRNDIEKISNRIEQEEIFEEYLERHPEKDSISRRGAGKLIRIAKVIAYFLEQEFQIHHLDLALLLRQDLDLILREEPLPRNKMPIRQLRPVSEIDTIH